MSMTSNDHSGQESDTPPTASGPPQVFGSNPEGSPRRLSAIAGSYFGQDTNLVDADDGGESNEAKRRRIARACDMCRKKKIKCDGKMPSCTHCINYKTECIFTQVEKKRNPPKGAKYIEGLENRLGRMESLLRLSGLLSEEDNGKTDLGTLEKRLADKSNSNGVASSLDSNRSESMGRSSPAVSSHQSSTQLNNKTSPPSSASVVTSPESRKETREEVEDLSDMMCSLVTNSSGETRYTGPSSGFSIFSPKGIQWVSEKTGDQSFQEMLSSSTSDENTWNFWKPDVFGDIFSHQRYKELPSKPETLSLLKDFFENFNCMFPLFHEPTFMHLVNRQYTIDPYQGSGWWASLNIALAIAHRLRVMSNLVPKDEDQKAWEYLKNALAVMPELVMRNTDLLSVQALLGMAMFLQGSPNPQPSFFLISAAVRLSHSIGIHRKGSGFNLSPEEIEQRKRVFWIGYMLDKDVCLRSGCPPAQDDDDFNVELPTADPADNIGNIPLSDGKSKTNLFRLMCTFALIESKVYKQLYSTKAAKQSDGELLNTIGQLDQELEDWKEGIPVDFRPEHEIKAAHTPLILHVVVLHFSYYNCLTTIHRMSVHHGYWTNRLSNYAIQGLNARPLNPRVFSSAALCVSAARASIQLIKYIPQGDFACVWMIIYFPVSALVTLFANVLQNPQDGRARQDVRLMSIVCSFLSTLGHDKENGSIKRLLCVCSEFERIARVVLQKSERDNSSRRKRKSHAEDPNESHASNVPIPGNPTTPGNVFTASSSLDQSGMIPPATNYSTDGAAPFSWGPPEFEGADESTLLTPPTRMTPGYADIQAPLPLAGESPYTTNSFQQPFVPQDLWQMPMTLEWDWADMTGNQFPVFRGGDDSAPPGPQ